MLINLDETAVHYYYGDRKGNVFKKTKNTPEIEALRQNVSRKDMRACVTHAALVAEDPAIQQLLPQWVLGNMSVMLKRDVAKVQPLVSPNIQFIRGKSGWMNATMMVKLLRAIKLALTPVDYEKQTILMLIVHGNIYTLRSQLRLKHATSGFYTCQLS